MIFAIPQKKKKNNYIDDMPLGKDQVTTNNNITNVNICIIIEWRYTSVQNVSMINSFPLLEQIIDKVR